MIDENMQPEYSFWATSSLAKVLVKSPRVNSRVATPRERIGSKHWPGFIGLGLQLDQDLIAQYKL